MLFRYDILTCSTCEMCWYSMDKDHSLTIDWFEWRDHFLFNPLHNIEEIAQYWKHSVVRSKNWNRGFHDYKLSNSFLSVTPLLCICLCRCWTSESFWRFQTSSRRRRSSQGSCGGSWWQEPWQDRCPGQEPHRSTDSRSFCRWDAAGLGSVTFCLQTMKPSDLWCTFKGVIGGP